MTRPRPAGVLLTGRNLILRDFQDTDVDAVHAIAGDPEVTRFTDWGPNTMQDSVTFIADAVAQARETPRAEFHLAAVDAATGVLVGSVAVGVTDPAHRQGELGYVFHRDHWGRGLATEAATLLLSFGFTRLALRRISATCHPDNLASARVLEKAGLRREGRLRSNRYVRDTWRDSLLFAALDDD
ncbi:RimJ/RimL family protein N-acetyltransferase [Actinoalloteichus hoggarensis]|uniref:Putative ribosomal N-acetyltransferase YdaF n=1 Tax=Actinoalloteichus hoggarensis TaxID=1470176 RepID=A0A221W4L6_9PSEU|nr:GNAT family N-acetyltransferase [Actinoalloteichus hoggarensis]ASO20529.1 Putative ribosomal N-acetyltransferase YdaF [Actinoalloteichus hoggarensis]MBB5923569.1 RimJ/RimL family protein N-acetyltransferase [Actinoalloteichus hoggarensis]